MAFLIVLLSVFGFVYSDYDCLCNYNVEKSVLPSPSSQVQPIGYLYEFDCKELIGDFSSSSTWVQIAFEHKIGYIENDAQIQSQICPGDPPLEDKVTTSTVRTTVKTTQETSTRATSPATTTITTTTKQSMPSIKTTTKSTSKEPVTNITVATLKTTTIKTTTTTSSTMQPSTKITRFTTTGVTSPATTPDISTSTFNSTHVTTSQNVTTARKLVCPLIIQQAALSERSFAFVNDDNGKCYELVTFTRTWSFAENDCLTKGGHLTSIKDVNEENFLSNHVQAYGSTTWIGLNDKTVEEHFEWSSGDNVGYVNWKPGRKDPTKHSTDDCVTIGTLSGTWDDESCANYHAYICKFDAVADNGTHVSKPTYPTLSHSSTSSSIAMIPSTTSSTERLECPQNVLHAASTNGETTFISQERRICYELVTRHKAWDNAETDCQRKGGHLATITNSREEQLVYHYVKSYGHNTWIGLNDQTREEHFQWASGVPVSYYNWHTGRLDIYTHKFEDCVAMGPRTGTWEDMDCLYNYYAYVCEYNAVTGHQGSFASVDGNTQLCTSSVRHLADRDNGILGQFERACYELIPNSDVSWQHGEDMCQSRGGHLAHISNQQQQTFIQSFLSRHSPQHAVWIGLHDTRIEGAFEWTAGTSVSFTNWISGHESNFESYRTEDCVAFIPYKNGKWDDIPCGNTFDLGETHPILCQYKIPLSPGIVG
ncbi:macrophage mannose receptor 1-like [Ruditapes philippinarum]|uniref:macrophage mannose receptor 1-like n=1 Tax=Ruditapes philippinarum TaxID=129788 RepID=UPI00295A86E2|nr:macrophage mannose receptor 1-like [Ruditapes philippinarum]XP_060585674.1 macrophage mannose receptor 1-like [Ruditapes philippinarum]